MDLKTLKRFWSHVSLGDLDECWLWHGCGDGSGYGAIMINGRRIKAHRFAYETTKGPIAHELDHLCRTPLCVNPNHLEDVTHRENTLRGVSPQAANARKTHCIHGHEFTPENTATRTSGGRQCRVCGNRASREYQRRKAAKKREAA